MSYSKGDIVLLPYPFTHLKTTKVRPAVVAAKEDGRYADVFVVPVTSRIENLNTGEFVLRDWDKAGLNVVSARLANRLVFQIDPFLMLTETE